MGRAGEGWNPLRAGYLQYAVFALRRQEESEKASQTPLDYAGTFTLPATFRENLASSVILVVTQVGIFASYRLQRASNR